MAFEDLAELIEPLELTIKGKTYRLPPVSLEGGITLKSIIDGNEPDVTDDVVSGILLGDTLKQMVDDGIPGEWIGRVLLTALTDFRAGRFTAEIMWKTGGDTKAIDALAKSLAPNRASRRKASTSTAVDGTTKPRVSTSGTRKSRKK